MSASPPTTDIENRTDIEGIVVAFYERAFADPLLGPIFIDIAHLDLDTHLPIISDFWENVILRTRSYRRGAFEPHRKLNDLVPLGDAEFTRWLELWEATVSSRHAGERTDLAIRQAHRFAQAFQRRLH